MSKSDLMVIFAIQVKFEISPRCSAGAYQFPLAIRVQFVNIIIIVINLFRIPFQANSSLKNSVPNGAIGRLPSFRW